MKIRNSLVGKSVSVPGILIWAKASNCDGLRVGIVSAVGENNSKAPEKMLCGCNVSVLTTKQMIIQAKHIVGAIKQTK